MAGRLRAAFIAAAAAWPVLLLAATWLAARAHASAIGSAVIIGVYTIGSAICHQLPERSFHLWSAQMPVCARCTGIYFGAVIGATAGALSRRAKALRHKRGGAPDVNGESNVPQGFSPANRATNVAQGFSPASGASNVAPGLSPAWVRAALLMAVAPSLATLAFEWSTGIMPPHAIRAAAGLVIGVVVAWLVVAAADNQVN